MTNSLNTYVKVAGSIMLCLLTLAANAQDQRYIRVNEEKTLDFGQPVGKVHLYTGEIFLETEDNPKGKYIAYKDTSVLLTYGTAGSGQPGTINYSKLYETDTALNQEINRKVQNLQNAIRESLTIREEGSSGNLLIDLQGLDSQFDERVKVQIANDATVRFTNDSIRQGQVSLARLDFPLRVIPAGYPTFWLDRDRIQAVGNEAVARREQTPATTDKAKKAETGKTGEAENEPVGGPGWLLWAIALLALAATVLSALSYLSGQKDNGRVSTSDLVANQKEILNRLPAAGAAVAAVNSGSTTGNSAAANKEIKSLKDENARLGKELESYKKSRAEQDSKLAAAATRLNTSGEKALMFQDDTKAFAEHRMEVISQALALYSSLVHLVGSGGDGTINSDRNLLAGIVLGDRLFHLANKARVYGVELERLAVSGVWTDPAHVRKLKDEPNEANRLEYIDKDRYKNVLAPFLSKLSVMLETVRNLSRFSGQTSTNTEQAGDIGSKAHELRKAARQLLGIEMDYVPLFSPVADHPHVNAVPGDADDYTGNAQVDKNHILQIKDYGMAYGDSKSGTEVILKR